MERRLLAEAETEILPAANPGRHAPDVRRHRRPSPTVVRARQVGAAVSGILMGHTVSRHKITPPERAISQSTDSQPLPERQAQQQGYTETHLGGQHNEIKHMSLNDYAPLLSREDVRRRTGGADLGELLAIIETPTEQGGIAQTLYCFETTTHADGKREPGYTFMSQDQLKAVQRAARQGYLQPGGVLGDQSLAMTMNSRVVIGGKFGFPGKDIRHDPTQKGKTRQQVRDIDDGSVNPAYAGGLELYIDEWGGRRLHLQDLDDNGQGVTVIHGSRLAPSVDPWEHIRADHAPEYPVYRSLDQ